MPLFASVRPETARTVLLVLVGGGYLGCHLFRWWRRWRASVKAAKPAVPETPAVGVPPAAVTASVSRVPTPDDPPAPAAAPAASPSASEAASGSASSSGSDPAAPSGEELYAMARRIPHQAIPDFAFDGEYLKLLGRSAARGYAPALAKLGEYAMRRAAWVEAYYWMSMAKRRGMRRLDDVLQEIRKSWTQEVFPDQSSNVSEIFSVEAGSVGRALLHLDCGYEAAAARKFLNEHCPGCL